MSTVAYFVQQRNPRLGKLIPKGPSYHLTKIQNL